MGYNFKNAFVCLWANAPIKLSDVSSVPIAELVVIGEAKAESGYKVVADEKVLSSTQAERAVSQKLDLRIEILTPYAPSTFLADMDNKQNCLVFVNSDDFPDLAVENTSEAYNTLDQLLTAAEYAMPEDVTCTVLSKKITTHVEEDVKYGGGKVIPFVITGMRGGVPAKTGLRKDDVPLVNE